MVSDGRFFAGGLESGPGGGTGIEGLHRLGKSLYGAIDDIQ